MMTEEFEKEYESNRLAIDSIANFSDTINKVISGEMVTITKKEYDELLEYKYMYEELCE